MLDLNAYILTKGSFNFIFQKVVFYDPLPINGIINRPILFFIFDVAQTISTGGQSSGNMIRKRTVLVAKRIVSHVRSSVTVYKIIEG